LFSAEINNSSLELPSTNLPSIPKMFNVSSTVIPKSSTVIPKSSQPNDIIVNKIRRYTNTPPHVA